MKTQIAPWRERFLNVVERSIVELNIQFNNYSIGQTANGETKKRMFDKTIQGIEFADELTVCSAIVNDCISSSLISGDIDKGSTNDGIPKMKFYKIQREVTYEGKGGSRVDITTQRVDEEEIIQKAQGLLSSRDPYPTSYIEAKRAKRYSNSTLDSEEKLPYHTTSKVFKFETEERLNKYEMKNKFFYILVWGVWNSEKERENTPRNYLTDFIKDSCFTIKDEDRKVRWIPLSWNTPDSLDNPETEVKIEKWCWVLLAQVTKIISPSIVLEQAGLDVSGNP